MMETMTHMEALNAPHACLHMQQLIECLVAKHQGDLLTTGVQLLLALPDLPDRLLISCLSDQRISITHCMADQEENLMCDVDMVFCTANADWYPLELVNSDAIWQAYVQATADTCDENSDLFLENFAEYWATSLQAQGWLTKGHRQHTLLTATESPSLLQLVVEQLAITHGIDLTSFAAYLWLDLPGTNKALIVAKADGEIISLAYCTTDEAASLVPEIEAVCALMITGHWYVGEIRYSPEVWAEFIQCDARRKESFEEFAEWFGMKLKAEDWLTHAHLVFADWKK